ncbi:MAG: SUF system Fe-S cluster assembly regulator [Panacagrimonas sp.]
MFKLGKLTDYGTVLMTALAVDPARQRTAQELATRTHLAAPTVAKLLKLLGKAGLVESLRGAHGGYRLARSPDSISVADIVSALQGPIALTECAVHAGCGIESHCGVRSNWRVINDAIRSALEAVTLAQMTLPLQRSAAPRGDRASHDIPIRFSSPPPRG